MTAQDVTPLEVHVGEPGYHILHDPYGDRREYGVMVRILCNGIPIWSRLVQGPDQIVRRRRNRLGEWGAYVPVPPEPEAVEAAVKQAEALVERYGSIAPGARVLAPVSVGGKREYLEGTVESLDLNNGVAVVHVEVPQHLRGLLDDRCLVFVKQLCPA